MSKVSKMYPKPTRVTMKQKTARLTVSVSSAEKRYGCSSEDMIIALKAGTAKETREVSQWLFNYRSLKRLEGNDGHTNGISMKVIKPSIGGT